MPFLLVPVGAYLYGRFVDGDGGVPWIRILLMLGVVGFIVYFFKAKR